jgi:RHS repeat-associated protein
MRTEFAGNDVYISKGLYYLNARYYDSKIGRFINADSLIAGIGGSTHGYNAFAYCFNNPVNMSDLTGNWPHGLLNLLQL